MGAVLDFVDSGHDLIVAADVSTSDLIRNIATELGVDFDEVCELPDRCVMLCIYEFSNFYEFCIWL